MGKIIGDSSRGRAHMYRDGNKGMQILLSYSQAWPGRKVKQEQEEISRNHVQAFIPGSVHAVRRGDPDSLLISIGSVLLILKVFPE